MAGPLALGRAASRLRDVELSPIKAIELAASRLPGVVSLAQGIPSFDTPEAIKRFAQERIAEGVCARYSVTPGLPELREAVADSLDREGMRYDPDQEILVTVGSIEAIAATLLATIDPGEEVLVFSPSYASYVPAIRLAGGVPRFVALNEDANFDLDPEAIEQAVGRRTRALLLCNPNNPTGTVFSREQTLRMLAIAERHDLLVIADEVYKDFVYGGTRIFSAAMEPAARHRVIRVCSFSKAYGMTGWRVGFLHAEAGLVAEIVKVHDALVTCAPVVSQYAALAALEHGEAAIAEFRAEFRRRRDHVIERLDALPHVFDYQKPNASYFVFPRLKDTVANARDSRRLADELLQHARVALVPGVAFGPSGEAHLRLCYARSPADVDLAFDRLERFFSGRPAHPVTPAPPAAAEQAAPPRSYRRRLGRTVLAHLARARLARNRPRVVAITGGQGMTVMKRTLVELLAGRFRVRANPLSYNTELGLPLAVLGAGIDTRRLDRAFAGLLEATWAAYVRSDPVDVMILELGIRRAGDMRAHLQIVRPEIVVVTPLVPSFSADGDALAVLRQEVELLAASGTGTVLLSADDPALADLARKRAAATFSGTEISGGSEAPILDVAGKRWRVGRDAVGQSGRAALAAAVRVGRLLGMSDGEIERFLEPGG